LEWIGLASCRSQQRAISLQESKWFVADLDQFGDWVEYSREVLVRQRGPVGAEEIRAVVREVQEAVGDVVLVVDAIVGSHVAPLREDLRGLRDSVEGLRVGFKEVRVSMLDAGTGEALSQLRELWVTNLGSLETLVFSTKCSEAAILKEMRQVKVALEGKLLQLDVAPDLMDNVVGEVEKLREEIVSMNRARSEGESQAEEKLKRLLGEMKAVRSQLDRLESAVSLLARGVRVAFEEVRVSLRSANNEEAMSELRELWVTNLGSLETLVLSTKCSEAAILKEMRQVKVALEGKLLQLDVASDLMDNVVGEVEKLREEMRLATSEQMSELLEELKRVVG
jgi:hypothetical protein